MGLSIRRLGVSRFRNYGTYDLDDLSSLNVLVGRNGAGKTNLLEAVQLLTSCMSMRGAHAAELVKQGEENALVWMEAADENRLIETRLSIERGKRSYKVNGKARQVSDVKGTLPAVTFTPDDLELAKKSSGVKRRALDNLGTQLSKSYHVVARDYEKSVRYKNRLLKEEAPRDMLFAINDTLLICATQLFCFRQALFNRIVPLVKSYYAQISSQGEEFDAILVPSWGDVPTDGPEYAGSMGSDDEEFGALGEPSEREPRNRPPARPAALGKADVRRLLEQGLQSRMAEEIARRRCVVGPHCDAVVFTLDGRDVSSFASQGQQRSVVLAWKMAEVEIARQSLGVAPVLLLDDVMSELDEQRRRMLVEFIDEDVQTFMTATDLSSFDASLLDRAHVIEVGKE